MVTSIKTARTRLNLSGAWQFAYTEHPLPPDKLTFNPCIVPGCIETDLHALGILPDPFVGMNPVTVNEFAQKQHVYYRKQFEAYSHEGIVPYLIFEGVDCFAEVYLNGKHIASLSNMLIGHEMDVSRHLADGKNELLVHIRPAREESLKYDYPQLLSALPVNIEALYIRKAGHMYGWDIMPRFVSAGLYRPVTLEYRPTERLDELFLRNLSITPNRDCAELKLFYKIKGGLYTKRRIKIEMICGGSTITQEFDPFFISGIHKFAIEKPKLWWPKGRGAANLYTVTVTLYSNDEEVDKATFRHGIRTVALERTATIDANAEGEFVFIVNGEKVFCKGTNWVPLDAFHHRDIERIPKVMDMVGDLNCNMIRCWGGNVYENELFYDLCDEMGMMVWQDFTMACAVYPQDEDFQKVIAHEAEAVVKRLRSHACVALWSGDNECDLVYGWYGDTTNPNTNVLTRKILPEAVRLHDGTRPYIASSPFLDAEAFGKTLYGKDHYVLPEDHLWGPRDYFKGEFYTKSPSKFVSEIGYHGCPSPESITKFISPDKMWPFQNNEEWDLHATSPVPAVKNVYEYRTQLMADQITELFTEFPDNLADFSFCSQVVQAEAKKFFIERYRMAKWNRTGILWWNLIDGWPQFSDAIVDYYFDKKLAYGVIKNCQQDVCVMLDEPTAWNQDVVIVNDTRHDARITLEIKDVETGEVVFDGSFTAKADASTVVGKLRFKRNLKRMFAITWTGDAKGKNHYLAGQPPFELAHYKKLLADSKML